MKTFKILLIFLANFSVIFYFYSCKESAVEPPVVEENPVDYIKTFGGSLSDRASCIIQTMDGGILAGGYTISSGSGGNDGLALKLDGKGNVQWYKVFGGSADDEINSVYQVSDGGYILVGETISFSSTSNVYAVKLDGSGNLVWSKYYNIAGNEYGYSVVQTADYGFLIAGTADGFGAGGSDALVIKINFDGNILWVRAYGGPFNDYGSSIKAYDDNSSIMAGYSFSGGFGGGDITLARLTEGGIIYWMKYYGGGALDQPYDLEITSDNGYIVCGVTYSFGLTSGDEYFIRTYEDGTLAWSRTFGGMQLDVAYSVKQTHDGQFVSTGVTSSFGAGQEDVFITKMFGDGVFNFSRLFGGSGNDAGTGIAIRSDTGYVTSGYSSSYGASNNDIFTATLGGNGSSCIGDSTFTPLGGIPNTVVTDSVNYTSTPLSSYYTMEAGTVINSISPSEYTICSQ
jgi:hypothetical protein